jgi:hypothetical protein
MKTYFVKSLDLSGKGLFKPYLCSRDIGIGDKFYRKYTKAVGYTPEMECIGMDTTGTVLYSEGINDDIYNPKDLCFKIIGEISPDAVWVKEGDEFDRDDIMYTVSDVDEPDEYRGCGSNFFKSTSLPKRIGIKCPTCKKFH